MIDTRRTMTERMALSAMRKYNTENAPYSYKSAILLEALLKASRALGNDSMRAFVRDMLESFVDEDGHVVRFRLEEYSMDNIRMGYVMLMFYEETGDPRYRKAVDQFVEMLKTQPRTPEGGYWHKGRYPNQMWLDGLFMQGPVHALYCRMFGGLKECLEDLAAQFELIYDKTYDPQTGLLRHAWDSSKSMPWCNPQNGQSQEVWGRAMGWYCMALADLLEDIPAGEGYDTYRERFLALAMKVAPVVLRYQDPGNGIWWQVMDKAHQGENYPESSASAMFIYFFAKMNRLGFLGKEYRDAAQKAFDGLIALLTTTGSDGEVFLHDTCRSAGLGKAGENSPYRPADFEYYTTGEPRDTDNLHGVSPFISAALEMEFPAQMNKARHEVSVGEDLNAVMSDCAGKAAVVVPEGHYTTGPLDVPPHTHLIFEEGAVLDFSDDFCSYPPVRTRWEGVDCWAMHPCFLIKDATDVVIEGPGTLDGHGEKWWDYIRAWKNEGKPARLSLAIEKELGKLNPNYLNEPGGGGGRSCQFLRPSLLQILDSQNVRIDGLRLTRSPFWTCHTVCSGNLVLRNLSVNNPYDSPNTDGMDIESCLNVEIRGCDIHVGDDGIAVKCGSGREMMASQRSENIVVEDCVVRNAHGGFVIGSETASGVKDVSIRNCRFLGTDRGIRIKTRRGRGGMITGIHASDIYMENVICAISMNMFYRCGSDDPSLYSVLRQPVTDDTPQIGDVTIERIRAVNCRKSAAFIVGLPEMPIRDVVVRDSTFEVGAEDNPALEAEMCSGIPSSDYRGIRVINADVAFSGVSVNVEPQVLVEDLVR